MSVAKQEGLFQALFKWGEVRSKEENFYSKSLVFLLKKLQEYDLVYQHDLASSFLNELLQPTQASLKQGDWQVDAHISYRDRKRKPRKIPDIVIESADLLAWVEVKVSSPVNPKQLQEYRRLLDSESEGKGKRPLLVLLTRLGNQDVHGHLEGQISWIEIWRLLKHMEGVLGPKDAKNQVAPEVYYIITDFRKFLKEKGMGVERASEVISKEGLEALGNLLLQLGKAIEGVKLAGGRKLRMQELYLDTPENGPYWLGWYFKAGKKKFQYSLGLYSSDPRQIFFGVEREAFRSAKQRLKRIGRRWYPDDEDEKAADFRGSLSEGFEHLSEVEQYRELCKVVETLAERAGLK